MLGRTASSGAVLVTEDKDFGELAYGVGLPAECGIVLLRLDGRDADADNQFALAVLHAVPVLTGNQEFNRQHRLGGLGRAFITGQVKNLFHVGAVGRAGFLVPEPGCTQNLMPRAPV